MTRRTIIAESFEDLLTEVIYEIEVSPVFLDLNPELTDLQI
jgi:hypothetical protein